MSGLIAFLAQNAIQHNGTTSTTAYI